MILSVQRALAQLERPLIYALFPAALAFQVGGLSHAQIAVAGDLIFIEEDVGPGDSYSGTITIRNVGGAVATATIYLNDVLFQGVEQAYVEPGSLPRSNAGWIELELGSVQLEGGESASVGYTVTVPDEPGLHDSYWSMVMVENTPVGEGPGDRGVQIRSVTRYGIYIVTNMAEQAPLQLEFANPSLQNQEDPVFSVAVANSAQRLVRPGSYLDLYDANGAHVRRMETEPALIFPESEVVQTYRLGQLNSGTYTAIVVVDAGGADVFGARYTLEIGEQ